MHKHLQSGQEQRAKQHLKSELIKLEHNNY